jgi:hypothetical protein
VRLGSSHPPLPLELDFGGSFGRRAGLLGGRIGTVVSRLARYRVVLDADESHLQLAPPARLVVTHRWCRSTLDHPSRFGYPLVVISPVGSCPYCCATRLSCLPGCSTLSTLSSYSSSPTGVVACRVVYDILRRVLTLSPSALTLCVVV